MLADPFACLADKELAAGLKGPDSRSNCGFRGDAVRLAEYRRGAIYEPEGASAAQEAPQVRLDDPLGALLLAVDEPLHAVGTGEQCRLEFIIIVELPDSPQPYLSCRAEGIGKYPQSVLAACEEYQVVDRLVVEAAAHRDRDLEHRSG